MYGAIFGDIIGSRFEFDRGGKTKDFDLFTPECDFTDDTVMTIAVGEALMNAGKDASAKTIKAEVLKSMQEWGHRYPNAGYGGMFYNWLFCEKNPKPYNSFGNGSAMRVSAAGWLYDSLERTREVAGITAAVTHNHPEGIKGAECTATVMYLARTGASKEEIKSYVTEEFGYDLSESLDEMRMRHEHVETCQDSLPKALVSFLEGENYEDVIRNAVSLGGDTDTLAAIAGAMAEAMYGIPAMLHVGGKIFFTEEIASVLEHFDEACGRPVHKKDYYAYNDVVERIVRELHQNYCEENVVRLMDALLSKLIEGGEAPTPMVDKDNLLGLMDVDKMIVGQTLTLDRDVRLTIDKMEGVDGRRWIPYFTNEKEVHKGATTNIIINLSVEALIGAALSEDVDGIVINPFGDSQIVPLEMLRAVKKAFDEK